MAGSYAETRVSGFNSARFSFRCELEWQGRSRGRLSVARSIPRVVCNLMEKQSRDMFFWTGSHCPGTEWHGDAYWVSSSFFCLVVPSLVATYRFFATVCPFALHSEYGDED